MTFVTFPEGLLRKKKFLETSLWERHSRHGLHCYTRLFPCRPGIKYSWASSVPPFKQCYAPAPQANLAVPLMAVLSERDFRLGQERGNDMPTMTRKRRPPRRQRAGLTRIHPLPCGLGNWTCTVRTPRSPVLLAPMSLHDPLPSRTLRIPQSPALLAPLSPLLSRYRRKVLCNKRQAHTRSSAQDTSQTQVRRCRSPAIRESRSI